MKKGFTITILAISMNYFDLSKHKVYIFLQFRGHYARDDKTNYMYSYKFVTNI